MKKDLVYADPCLLTTSSLGQTALALVVGKLFAQCSSMQEALRPPIWIQPADWLNYTLVTASLRIAEDWFHRSLLKFHVAFRFNPINIPPLSDAGPSNMNSD